MNFSGKLNEMGNWTQSLPLAHLCRKTANIQVLSFPLIGSSWFDGMRDAYYVMQHIWWVLCHGTISFT